MPRWGPAKPKTRIKIIDCGAGHWDEQDHGLDIPHGIHTTDFKVTGTGHQRIERAYSEGCRNNWQLVAFEKGHRELEIVAWLCQHTCSFVLFDTKARATVICFERHEDAEAFRQEFVR
jgi:hypothetical protein